MSYIVFPRRRLESLPRETSVLKLLSIYLAEQGKELSVGGGGVGGQFDAYAPDGVDDLPGPTVVEILAGNKDDRPFQLSEARLERIVAGLRQLEVASILLVILSKVSTREQARIIKKVRDSTNKIPISIWDMEKVTDVGAEYGGWIRDPSPDMVSSVFEDIVKRSLETKPDDWKQIRERYVRELKAEYRANRLVLFLGAGVSLSTGKIPDWERLLSRLFIATVETKLPPNLSASPAEKELLVSQLHKSYSAFPLVAAQYIHANIEVPFAEAVSAALYQDINPNADATSELLHAIAQLCVPRRRGPGIQAVVNYNFDDLLEKHFERLALEYRSIYRDVDVASDDELAIYHVHGFLPREVSEYDGASDNLLVLSEEGYHALYLDPYSWSNITQLNYLRQSTCIMIGLSLTDPNLRRLLDIAARKINSPKHYAFLKREDSGIPESTEGSATEIKPEVLRAFSSIHHSIQENSLRRLGVNVVWIESYDEIPRILNSLKSR